MYQTVALVGLVARFEFVPVVVGIGRFGFVRSVLRLVARIVGLLVGLLAVADLADLDFLVVQIAGLVAQPVLAGLAVLIVGLVVLDLGLAVVLGLAPVLVPVLVLDLDLALDLGLAPVLVLDLWP